MMFNTDPKAEDVAPKVGAEFAAELAPKPPKLKLGAGEEAAAELAPKPPKPKLGAGEEAAPKPKPPVCAAGSCIARSNA